MPSRSWLRFWANHLIYAPVPLSRTSFKRPLKIGERFVKLARPEATVRTVDRFRGYVALIEGFSGPCFESLGRAPAAPALRLCHSRPPQLDEY